METASRRTPQPNFILSPHQQSLLFAALNSNRASASNDTSLKTTTDPLTMAPMSFNDSPVQQAPGSGTLNGFEESPFIDYDYDFDADAGFDYDFGNDVNDLMIGKLPGSSSDGDAEAHDKRGHPDDEDDEEGGGKRRESDDKLSKKPGRKPLTSEPTSKRKAQNRAAQRAFRERKEKHLKDLETKVQDLEKASEAANHENNILRAQVEKMSVEIREYRKRLSQVGAGRSPPLGGGLPPYLAGKGSSNNTAANPNDVNFSFEFPQFGKLPGPVSLNASSIIASQKSTPSIPGVIHRNSSSSNKSSISPLEQPLQHTANFASMSSNSNNSGLQQDPKIFGLDELGLFNSPGLDILAKDFNFDQPIHAPSNPSRSNSESTHGPNSNGQSTYSSPSASSNLGSNAGLTSSCGTSPEPYTQSPAGFKSSDNILSTIGEEHNSGEGNFQNPSFDINGIDWFAQQNGNQFDPQLFGDYREPQNNILSGGLYDDTFFAEAFSLPEFNTNSPFVMAASPAPPKKDLVQEIDQKLNQEEEVVPGEDRSKLLTCNSMWEKIQACPSVQSGNIDMDDLCSQLQSKAKCSGDGPVINEEDFKQVIHSILKKPQKEKA